MHEVKSIEVVRESQNKIKNANDIHIEKLSMLDKVALLITNKVGTMGFFLTVFTWTVIWLGWNTFGPTDSRFDPYPAFVLWLFISNMIQIFLMPLLMIGQNLQSQHSEARAESSFNIAIKSEEEIEMIIKHLENQNILLNKILEKLDNHK